MTDRLPDHFCPGCGARQKPFARYPWYFCNACRRSATDSEGRALEFANESLSGGFMYRRVGEDDWTKAGSAIALIHGRKVKVHEARFGGIVAEPVTNFPIGAEPYRMVDLTRPGGEPETPPKKPRGRDPFGR